MPRVRSYHENNGTLSNLTAPEETAQSLQEGLKRVSALMKRIGLEPQQRESGPEPAHGASL